MLKRPKISLMHLFMFCVGFGAGAWCFFLNRDLFVPSYLEKGRTSGIAGCAGQVARIGLALETYAAEHGELPQSQNDLIPRYLEAIPKCPVAERVTYRTTFGAGAGYNKTDNPDYYLVECCGVNHGSLFVAPNFPAYDNLEGLRVEQQW